MSSRVEMIRKRLEDTLAPEHLHIEDQSALHAGHPGARGGGGHFAIVIVSDQFKDKSMIQRHRMVYKALNDEMQTEIHALSIKSLTSAEYLSEQQS